jgi:hypothetical protein
MQDASPSTGSAPWQIIDSDDLTVELNLASDAAGALAGLLLYASSHAVVSASRIAADIN